MAGAAAADLPIRGVRGRATHVAGGGRVDAVELPEEPLGAPEAAKPKDRGLQAVGKRRLKPGPEDRVTVWHGKRRLGACQRVAAAREEGERHPKRESDIRRGRATSDGLSSKVTNTRTGAANGSPRTSDATAESL
jgi:hypothetical protein